MRRLPPLAIVTMLVVLGAGCSTSKPGEKTVAPLPTKIIGNVPKAAAAAPVAAKYKHGDPTAGRKVFLNAGCTGCHTLADAHSTGTVGPNLDQKKPPLSLVVLRVTKGKNAMPPFLGQLSTKQIANVAAYVVKATGGNPTG